MNKYDNKTLFRDIITKELRPVKTSDYGSKSIHDYSNMIPKNQKPFTKKIHKGESLEHFKLRRMKCNNKRRIREKIRKILEFDENKV